MKLLYIDKFCFLEESAIENFIYSLANRIKDRFETTILVSNNRRRTRVENIRGINIIRMARFFGTDSSTFSPTLPLWMRRIKSDVIHFNVINPFIILSYLLARPRAKTVCFYSFDTERKRFSLYKSLLIRFFKRVDRIVVSDQSLLENSEVLKGFQEKCEVIPCGVDVKKFDKLADIEQKVCDFNERYGYDLIIYTGDLIRHKGVDYLIEAMKDVDAKLLVLGDGPMRKKWEALAKKSGVIEKVIFLGNLPPYELRAYLHSSIMLVLPSLKPSVDFEIIQLGAFACRIPVVSTDLGSGIAAVNRDRETGFVVPPRDSKALSEAINTLLKNEKLRLEFAENARQKVEKYYNLEYISSRMVNLYERLAGKDSQSV